MTTVCLATVLTCLCPPRTHQGLRHLSGLKKLARLQIPGIKVTVSGVAALKKAIPGLVIRH